MARLGVPGGRISVGLVGCGAIVELGHVPALQALKADCRVEAVVDLVEARRQVVGDALGVARGARFENIEALRRDGVELDLVVVALPSMALASTVRRLLAAGARVLSEKPLAPTVRQARAAVPAEAAERLGVIHNYRYRSDVRAALAHLSTGSVGTPRFIRLEDPHGGHFPGRGSVPDWRRDPRMSGGGCLLDNAYHWIYVARALAGADVATVAARAASSQTAVEDLAILTLEHVNGVVTIIETAWCAPGAATVLELHGSRGSLRLTGDTGTCEVTRGTSPAATFTVARVPAFTAMYSDVFAAVRRGTAFGASVDDCVGTLRVIEAAYRSARTGRVRHLRNSGEA